RAGGYVRGASFAHPLRALVARLSEQSRRVVPRRLKQWDDIADDRGRERVPVLGERIVRRNDEDQMIVIPAMGHDPYVVAARELMVRGGQSPGRSEEHTSELQSRENLVCRLLLEKKKT